MLLKKVVPFVLCVHSLFFCFNSAQEIKIQTYMILQNSTFQYFANVISALTFIPKTRCSFLCDRSAQCIAFGYSKTDDKCELYDGLTERATSFLRSGWILYIKTSSIPCAGPVESVHHTYPMKLVPYPLSRDKAEEACTSVGEHLVDIATTDKFQFVQAVINSCSDYQSRYFWVGGTNINAADFYAIDAWKQYDGSVLPLSGPIWCPGKPGFPHEQHCVQLDMLCSHKLNDHYCSTSFAYICEP